MVVLIKEKENQQNQQQIHQRIKGTAFLGQGNFKFKKNKKKNLKKKIKKNKKKI
jgi:hypothetical protein